MGWTEMGKSTNSLNKQITKTNMTKSLSGRYINVHNISLINYFTNFIHNHIFLTINIIEFVFLMFRGFFYGISRPS